ncbi:2-oxoisovalerate dehydrogenase E1 component [Krasilnikovia cinnamomea]|uniref:3-methyl-2-oxobutanoate dehydrogenase (2-methylpropanoyl-transferring) n=1 Tax=Krasilnikovia cinnamomea TaxID=349313 RepID=A0A4Q7ZNY1_9ACTN|nr:transketolase C-terminal domain-containing protein [Krasilnikovia cinnamomea]RZU52750.1 2-oxoisovalerate dehydrogenase E1 component [Krasilnikovia cinnamomea]
MLGRVTTPQNLDERFRDAVSALSRPSSRRTPDEPVRDGADLTGARARQLFDAQLTSRHLDLAARWLRSFNEGFHPVGAAGHEGSAAVAAALRGDDPALLHDRSAGFYCARAAAAALTSASAVPTSVAPTPAGGPASTGEPDHEPGDPFIEAARDVLRSVVASASEAMSGGRHRALGHTDLHIVPTTSAAAGHLPRAVGLAFGLTRADELDGVARPWPADAIVIASVRATAIDHADAVTALNTAGRHDHAGQRLPLLVVCEDDGPGRAAGRPTGWVADMLRSRPGLRYTAADGCDLVATYAAAAEAAGWVREHRRPAVLHLSMVPLLRPAAAEPGGAANGIPAARTPADRLAEDLARDPLVGTARLLVEAGLADPDELIARYDEVGWQVRKVAEEVLGEPKLTTAAEVVAPLAPRRPVRVARTVADVATRAAGAGAAARAAAFGGRAPEDAGPLTLAQTISATLTDALLAAPGAVVFGDAVTARGGYGITGQLRERFGPARVFDTPGDETSVLGLALGAGLAGLLPIPQIRHLAHLHQAAGQLRGEAATLPFASAGGLRNPLVIRVAGLAHGQPGPEHATDDHSVAALRDVPGLVVAVPARPADAAPMLRSCLAAAAVDGSVCVYLEPIALYHTRDLRQPGDNEWLSPYAPPREWAAGHVPIGRARAYPAGSGEDLTILTFGNGVHMSLRVAARLAEEGYGARVVDLRWLNPLPTADLVREAKATGRVLIVDETRRSGGVGEGVLAALVDGGFVGAARRIAAADSFIPLGPAAQHVVIGEDAITQGAHALLAR